MENVTMVRGNSAERVGKAIVAFTLVAAAACLPLAVFAAGGLDELRNPTRTLKIDDPQPVSVYAAVYISHGYPDIQMTNEEVLSAPFLKKFAKGYPCLQTILGYADYQKAAGSPDQKELSDAFALVVKDEAVRHPQSPYSVTKPSFTLMFRGKGDQIVLESVGLSVGALGTYYSGDNYERNKWIAVDRVSNYDQSGIVSCDPKELLGKLRQSLLVIGANEVQMRKEIRDRAQQTDDLFSRLGKEN